LLPEIVPDAERLAAEIVPVKVGLADKTRVDPLPVVVAADIAVPFPCKNPVTVVDKVIAGVVVAVATVPANPFAVTTDTDETVPVPDGKSAKTKERKVGCAGIPLDGPAKTVLADCVLSVKVNVPAVVTGLLLMV
jgi:hypothetical protein